MAKDVFISYKSEDFEQAEWVKSSLESRGISCWMAPMCIPGGSSYAAEIPSAIKGCKVFVLVFTDKTQTSRWVSRELDQAINQSKRILPFMLEECELREEFGFYLTNVQHYDGYRNKEKVLERLIGDVLFILEADKPPVEQPPVEQPPVEQPPVEQPSAEQPPAKEGPAEQPPAESLPVKKVVKPKKRRLWPWIVGGAVLVVLCLVALNQWVFTVKIAGTRFDRSEWTIKLENVTLTATDVEAISKLSDRTIVQLTDCTLETDDLSGLLSDNLFCLSLERCGVTDAMVQSLDFTAAPHLLELNLNGNTAISDLQPLAATSESLTHLEMADIPVSDANAIACFKNLRILRIDRTGMSDLRPLSEMIYLEQVYASGNGLSTLAGLENTSVLQTVDFSDNNLTSVEILSRSADTLTNATLSDNRLMSLESLKSCTQLRELAADGNAIRSLSALKQCRELVSVSAANNQLDTTSGLPSAQKLTYLDLSHNRLDAVDLGDVLSKEYSVNVNLSHNYLSLLTMPEDVRYRVLALQENKSFTEGTISDVSVSNVQNLKGSHLIIPWRESDAERIIKSGFSSVHLVDCPLDQRLKMEEALYGEEFLTAEEADAAVGTWMAEGT